MRTLLLSLVAVLALTAFPADAKRHPSPAPSAAAAGASQPTCPAGDPVVWVNTKSRVYHQSGDPYFGNTKSGKFLCASQANAAGYRAAGTRGPRLPGPSTSPSPSSRSRHHRNGGTGTSPVSPAPAAS